MSGSSTVRLIHKYFRNTEVHISGKIQVSHVTILQLGLQYFLFQTPLKKKLGHTLTFQKKKRQIFEGFLYIKKKCIFAYYIPNYFWLYI